MYFTLTLNANSHILA